MRRDDIMGHFYFVRHGQTVWNVENKICGATDSPLTEHGRQQAAETGKNIVESGIKADEILYSPLSRAADTAKIISEMSGIPCREEPRLIEQNFGLAGADAVEIIVVAVATFLVKFNSPIPFFADGFAETLLKLPPKTNTPAINNGIIFFVNFFLILLLQNHQ